MQHDNKKNRNNKKRRRHIISVVLVTLVACVGLGFLFLQFGSYELIKRPPATSTVASTADSKNGKLTIHPTFYVTGSSGTVIPVSWLTDQLLADKTLPAKMGLTIIADSSHPSKLTVTGTIDKANPNPMILFGTSKGTIDGHIYSEGLKAAMAYLASHYNVPSVNMLGYSSGGTGVIYYLMDHGADKSLPPVKKYLSLDGEYNTKTPLSAGESLSDVMAAGPKVKTPMYSYIEANYKKINPEIQMDFLEGNYSTVKQTDSTIPWSDTFSIYHLLRANGNPVTNLFYQTTLVHSEDCKNPNVAAFAKNYFYGGSPVQIERLN